MRELTPKQRAADELFDHLQAITFAALIDGLNDKSTSWKVLIAGCEDALAKAEVQDAI